MNISLGALTHELKQRGTHSETIGVFLVVAIILALILPMPSWLLDFLIAINISTSILLFVLVLQLKEATQFNSFPALLLITTLFRISLNVSSTRAILLEGEAGHIIQAFGEVAVGGNIVVGIIVFIILFIVQFIVITKGSERVAEVSARFVLDAMPGKQLAIDIEAKAGNISPIEAQIRRSRLASESQFFGAMDGALKFVKGDAIAALIIVITNLIGGVIVGVLQKDLQLSDAFSLYSILSIGDALVAQIPALLSSITAGLLITRSAGDSDQIGENMVNQIVKQLTALPFAWITAGVIIGVFGLLPGMPIEIFFLLGIIATTCGALLLSINQRELKEKESKSSYTDFDTVREFKPVCPFMLRFSSAAQPVESCTEVVRLARKVRNQLVYDYGLVSPGIETLSNVNINNADIEFCHNEVSVLKFDVPSGLRVATLERESLALIPINPIKMEPHPWNTEKTLAWFSANDSKALDELLIKYISDWELLETRIEAILFKLAPKHFGVEQAARILTWLASAHPDLAKELERFVSVQKFGDVLQRLLNERVSIRNIIRIVELLIEWGPRERDSSVLVECIRNGISREIANSVADNMTLNAILIEPSIEDRIRSSIQQTAFGDYIGLEADELDEIKKALFNLLKSQNEDGKKIIITSPDIRLLIRNLVSELIPELCVMSIPEVPTDFKVDVVGVVSIE